MTVTAGTRLRVGMHIGGEEVSAVGGRWFDSIDSFTGQAWGLFFPPTGFTRTPSLTAHNCTAGV